MKDDSRQPSQCLHAGVQRVQRNEHVLLQVLDWIKRKSPGLQERGLDEETVKKMQLSEYIDIIEDRWKSLQKIK